MEDHRLHGTRCIRRRPSESRWLLHDLIKDFYKLLSERLGFLSDCQPIPHLGLIIDPTLEEHLFFFSIIETFLFLTQRKLPIFLHNHTVFSRSINKKKKSRTIKWKTKYFTKIKDYNLDCLFGFFSFDVSRCVTVRRSETLARNAPLIGKKPFFGGGVSRNLQNCFHTEWNMVGTHSTVTSVCHQQLPVTVWWRI